ncbi:MAG: CHAT domain-containing protein [Deltaproteobacteria bacterium]|nr:MAG: CHAT domain-containing protein [Deltaproteobacteria bacterium]TMQ13390.1 MAG: CHAT domain-containing protein [Deltaproteobacteria bacterium]
MKVVINAGSIGTAVAAEVAHVNAPQLQPSAAEAIRTLLLAANPLATTRLRLDEEVRSIDQAIQRGRHRDRFELATQWALRIDELHSHLLRYRPEIVHFSGHGEAGALVLEDAHGDTRLLEASDLGRLVELIGKTIRCVVLSACFTQAQAEALADHVPCVVGTSGAIPDSAAIVFSGAFYEAIAHGEDVRTAFELGSQRINASGVSDRPRDVVTPTKMEAVAPILLGNADPRTIRFC